MTDSSAFILFGSAHLVTLALVAALSATTVMAARRDGAGRLARLLAVILVGQELAKLYVLMAVDDRAFSASLPLDLCRINAFLCAYLLLRRSYRTFEVAYFWAMGGSVTAMLTPDLAYGFPHPLYLTFFVSHGLVVLAVVYAIAGFQFRPRLRSVALTFAVTAGYAIVIAGVNHLLDTNYLFLRAKPERPTIMDLLGPWPVYVFGLFGLGLLICLACYAPFAWARRRR